MTETALPPRWNDVVTVPVEVVLAAGADGHDGSRLRIGEAGPLAVELVNRSSHELRLRPDTPFHLRVSLRPHTLVDHGAVALDPSAVRDGWMLVPEPAAGNGNRQVLTLTCAQPSVLAPGEVLAVRLTGVAADGFGGSRATHAAIEYAGLGIADDPAATLTGRVLAPLSLVHADPGPAAAHAGSTASTGALSARLATADSVIADGATRTMLRVVLHNHSGADIALPTVGENVPRIGLHTEAVGSLASSLLGSGRMAVSTESGHVPPGWTVVAPDNHALEPAGNDTWAAGGDLAFWLEIHSDAPPGLVPLHIRYENLPGVDDGVLTLLIRVGLTQSTIWFTDVAKPLRMWGPESGLELYTGDLNVSGDLAGWLSVDHDEADLGRLTIGARHGLTLDSPGGLTVTGTGTFPAVDTARLRVGDLHLGDGLLRIGRVEVGSGGIGDDRVVVGGVRLEYGMIRIGNWLITESPEGALEFHDGGGRVLSLSSTPGGERSLDLDRWRISGSGEVLGVLHRGPKTTDLRMIVNARTESYFL